MNEAKYLKVLEDYYGAKCEAETYKEDNERRFNQVLDLIKGNNENIEKLKKLDLELTHLYWDLDATAMEVYGRVKYRLYFLIKDIFNHEP